MTSAAKWGIGIAVAALLVLGSVVGVAIHLYRDAARGRLLVKEGYAAAEADDCATALAKFDAAFETRLPRHARNLALCNRGYCLEKLNRRDEALRDLTEALRLDPNNSWAFAARGRIHNYNGNTEQALADFSEAIRLNPNDFHALELRAAINLARHDVDKAIADFQEAIRARPNYAPLYFALGEARTRKNDWRGALASFDAAIRIDENYSTAYKRRAEIYELQHEWQKAMSDRARARLLAEYESAELSSAQTPATAPPPGQNEIEQGDTSLATGQLDRAIEHYNRVLAMPLAATHASIIYMNRGTAYLRKNQLDDAQRDYDKAIAEDPKNAAAYMNRGLVRGRMKQPEAAVADFTSAITVNEQFGEAYLYRAFAREEARDSAGAIADFQKAIELNAPGVDRALNSLAWLRATSPDASLRNAAEAVEFASRACELTRWQNAGYVDTLAAAYAEKGDFDKAVELQRKAVELATEPSDRRAELESRVALYERREPHRDDSRLR